MTNHLDVRPSFQQFHDLYDQQEETRGNNFLVYGPAGSGKSRLARTCRRPVLVHSFDPGGQRTNRVLLRDRSNRMACDSRFETENAKEPTAFRLWESTVERLEKEGVPDILGTYFLDSLTMWAEACMNAILKDKHRQGQPPQLQDYNVLVVVIRDWLKRLASWPCDVVVVGHVEIDKDEVLGRLWTTVMISGKLKVKVPLLFDEIYYSSASSKKGEIEGWLQTAPDGVFWGRTRLGTDGIFELNEKPDIRYLLQKAGENYEDLPEEV